LKPGGNLILSNGTSAALVTTNLGGSGARVESAIEAGIPCFQAGGGAAAGAAAGAAGAAAGACACAVTTPKLNVRAREIPLNVCRYFFTGVSVTIVLKIIFLLNVISLLEFTFNRSKINTKIYTLWKTLKSLSYKKKIEQFLLILYT
jgi:hypothetical protein